MGYEVALFEKQYNYGQEPFNNLEDIRYHISILSYDGVHGSGRQAIKRWTDLRFEQIGKYSWLFRRVAAKYQLDHPHKIIYLHFSQSVIGSKEDAELRQLKNKITAQKAKITIGLNNIEKAKKEWDKLFPIEDDVLYQAAIKKIKDRQDRLSALEFEKRQKEK